MEKEDEFAVAEIDRLREKVEECEKTVVAMRRAVLLGVNFAKILAEWLEVNNASIKCKERVTIEPNFDRFVREKLGMEE